jgi:hypothetical protein
MIRYRVPASARSQGLLILLGIVRRKQAFIVLVWGASFPQDWWYVKQAAVVACSDQ